MAATTLTIAVRSTDMSADGHVSVAMYVNFFEQSRLEHLRNAGLHYRPEAADFTVATTSVEFLAPAFYRDEVIVGARTAHVGRSSFALDYELRRVGDGAQICRGSSTQVWLGGQGRPTPLPDWLRAALRPDLPLDPDGALNRAPRPRPAR